MPDEQKADSELADAREKQGIRQADMAAKLGVTQATISNWESKSTLPSPKKWQAIADAYGISFRKLAAYCGALAS